MRQLFRSRLRNLASLLLPERPPPAGYGFVTAAVLIATETLVSFAIAAPPGEPRRAGIYLLGILVVAAIWGPAVGVAAALMSAAAHNFYEVAVGGGPRFSLERDLQISLSFCAAALFVGSLSRLARSRAAEAVRHQRDTEALLAEQAALRRVATLVAAGGSPAEVFAAVTLELQRLFPGYAGMLVRYEDNGTVTSLAGRDQFGADMNLGECVPIEGDNVSNAVRRTGRPARVANYDEATGAFAAGLRERGFHAGAGAPIRVENSLWGAAIVMSTERFGIPDHAEARLVGFTELVGCAIANADSRAQLEASRVRLVSAADKARRQIERDLHDGVQQRIVSLVLELRTAMAADLGNRAECERVLAHAADALNGIYNSLGELARGIHPAILAQGGIGPALKTLARRSTLPVQVNLRVEHPMSEPIEIAVYYVASEALTNAAKHSRASSVCVTVQTDPEQVHLSVCDDGLGGADAAKGSGLLGLRDRCEALGGRMTVRSTPGEGTTLDTILPLDCRDSTLAAAAH
ncbi:ATP-binding protein [Dactylosporangium sp. CS-033363]|uniref:GAF domain-containing sensor histidine kinase n=1 Tax=Dactylosporangium sp. CS-033363 TaxID=3239935 RepID=UPI003D90C096